MGTTFSTSQDCADAAGVKNLGDYSRPSTTNIDIWRSIICNKIKRVIGFSTADIDDVAKYMEIEKVMGIISHWLEDGKITDPSLLVLSKDDISYLSGIFDTGYDIEVFEIDSDIDSWA